MHTNQNRYMFIQQNVSVIVDIWLLLLGNVSRFEIISLDVLLVYNYPYLLIVKWCFRWIYVNFSLYKYLVLY